MKKISLIVFLVIVSLGFTWAQSTQTNQGREIKSPEERAELRTNRMAKALALNEQQTAKLKEANLAQARKMDALKKQEVENRQKFRQEASVIQNATEEQYKQILTLEQFEKYQSNKEHRTQNHRSRTREHVK